MATDTAAATATPTPTPTLVTLPEELIERIFDDVFAPTPSSTEHSPPRRTRTTHSPSPLLTCALIHRVAAPLFYRSVTLRSPAQTVLLSRTLQQNPELALAIRSLTLEGVWEDGLNEVLGMCGGAGADTQNPGSRGGSLQELDIVLDDGWKGKGWGPSKFDRIRAGSGGVLARGLNAVEVLGFCDALGNVRDLKRLTIRKEGTTYLTQLGPATILHYIGKHVLRWRGLVSTAFPFLLLLFLSRCSHFEASDDIYADDILLYAMNYAGTCGNCVQIHRQFVNLRTSRTR